MEDNVTRGEGLLEGYLSKRRAEVANSFIKRSMRHGKILDIGCGTYPYFLVNTIFKEKYGLDQIDQLNIPKDAKGHINIVNQDMEEEKRLPFKDNYFDCITLLAVMEHIRVEEINSFLKEVRRVLKPKGRFILTTPTPFANILLKIMAKLGLVSKEEIHEHEKVYTGRELQEALQRAGFKKSNIKTGLFEFFLNNWAFADK